MLVITRQSHQGIFIGEDIQVRVLAIQGGRVRLGIDAPRAIPVHRGEIYWYLKEQQAPNNPSSPLGLLLPTVI